MKQIRGGKPAPIKHDFSESDFTGELCPLCQVNKLTRIHQYPICRRCRDKLNIMENQLRNLQAHRLVITEEFIDWEVKPNPELKGTIDNIPWHAEYISGRWEAQLLEEIGEHASIAILVQDYLKKITPTLKERRKVKKSKIRRYFFMATCGTTMVTAAYFIRKHYKKS